MEIRGAQRTAHNAQRHNFGRIGVLMGGPSAEREISLKSGKAVHAALKDLGLDAVGIDIETADEKKALALLRSQNISCAFIALHGCFGEDGTIQKILEKLKIPYTGSGVSASMCAMDKVKSRQIFQSCGLHVPRYEVFKKDVVMQGRGAVHSSLLVPLVVKPASCGSSIGLSIIKDEILLEKALQDGFAFDETVIVEEYIRGRELTVGVLNETALPVIEIVPKKVFFDYEAKYQAGMTDYIVPAELDEGIASRVRKDALSAHQSLGCFGCSRADIILRCDNTPFILEINTIPGFTSTSLLPKAAKSIGIEFGQLCLELLRLAYEKK
ncbi:MAG: D-alanine--D-alanine ligase [Candidatus Omnitrophota bacterium]|jgi:D-alanine-D-alanine ligase|nr:MAG: D-alanine--D-alanine ligase [Candidatus Omnitrophota bacterium]